MDVSRAVGLEKLDILTQKESSQDKKRKTTLETSGEDVEDRSKQFSDDKLSQDYFSFLEMFKNMSKPPKFEKIKKHGLRLIEGVHSCKLLTEEMKALVREIIHSKRLGKI